MTSHAINLKKLGNFNTFKLFYKQKIAITDILLIRRNKEIKRKITVLIFISVILLSNVIIFYNFTKNKGIDDKYYDKDENLKTSVPNLYENINGTGVNQDIRIYGNNKSKNFNNNKEYFEIPTYNSDDMYLTYGDFNCTLQNNYTTDYVIEDIDALHPLGQFIDFNFNTSTSYTNITIHNGTLISGQPNQWHDNNNATEWYILANLGLINFTIAANFFGTEYSPFNLEFNRSHILGLISTLDFRVGQKVNLTIRLKDTDSNWKTVVGPIEVDNSIGNQRIRNRLINTNLKYIDTLNSTFIQFIFENTTSSGTIQLYMREYNMKATYGIDLPITNTSYVALEFDLKGLKSTVNGFYAWIRTLDLQEASNAKLNITLFRANGTVIRDDELRPDGRNLRDPSDPLYRDIKPNMSLISLIDTNITKYNQDRLFYFRFNPDDTSNLMLYNYFIVIKSNISKPIYSLVTLPWTAFGDNKTEQQLKISNNGGTDWKNAKISINGNPIPQLDASSFRLNVKRGYMPSDFIINHNQTLRIQDLPFENLVNKSAPYNESSYLTWGLGRWNHNFSTPIDDKFANKFQIYLKWNKTITKGFTFNVTFSVNAYWIENATANYYAKYNEDPKWIFEYNLSKSDQSFTNWSFLEFWYVYHNYFNALNLTNPKGEKILNRTVEQTILERNPSKYKIVIPNSTIYPSGLYILNLTSFNFINKMHSYINYNGTLWETNGFMYGDNISISAAIQDHMLKAPKTGDMNATLFYPNGTTFPTPIFTSSSGIINESILFYDFNDHTILNLTNDVTEFGEYHLGFFWFNGSAIGCKELTIYIDTYDVELENFNYSSNLKKNIFSGKMNNMVYDNYTILVASVNETTNNPDTDFYPINNNEINKQFSLEIGDQVLPVEIKTFNQSENILNPGETINIKTSIQNTHPFIPFDVKIQANLVSCANDKWIITQNTSQSVTLNFSGHPDDIYEFSINLTIPELDNITKIWPGVNAPVRLGGAKTIITVFIEDTDVGNFISEDFSLLSNQTKDIFDGYIIALRTVEETGSPSIINLFERNESIYYPNQSLIMANVYDRNFVSSYDQFYSKFTLKKNSKFVNITLMPNKPVKGQLININSYLVTEFEDPISNRNITCQYYNNNEWIIIDTKLSDDKGYTSFSINTLSINFTEDLVVNLSWNGDTINGVSENITINVIHQVNELSINVKQNIPQIYRNQKTTLTIYLDNTGDSSLRISTINIVLNNELKYSIVGADYLQLDSLSPGESTHLIIDIEIKDINKLEMNLSIVAQNIISNENITFSHESSFKVFEPPIYENFIKFFSIFMISLIILLWIISILYSRRTMKKIEAPIEEAPKKPRKARYVKVSELKKPTPPKKIIKKTEETKEIAPKEKTDLDTLLEERGLAEKKKKQKK
ncbi:MAG: hypothetical protein ACFFB0_08055 [Promethearchaeota archaeon]